VDGVGGGELAFRLSAIGLVVLHGLLVLVCVLKGKYRLAVFALPIPLLALAGALRLARPGSVWARRWYSAQRNAAATHRANEFDERWRPMLARWDSIVGGLPDHPTDQPS
jgi:hypothetical protein